MSHGYNAVTWTPFKRRFDLWLVGGIAAYLATFIVISTITQPVGESFTPIQLLIRATGTLAFLLLTFILTIGPMARFTDRFKPFLYNRRHLGVTTCLIALVHAGLVLLWYHGFSEMNVFVSLFVSNPRYDSIAGFPFESLGFFALIILLLMAATSHDFYNANLAPGMWKALHMSVYLAYTLLVTHIVLGVLRDEGNSLYIGAVILSAGTIALLHVASAIKSSRKTSTSDGDGWLEVCSVNDLQDGRAKIIQPQVGEAIAIYRRADSIYAISNACRHQGGPLGEGRVIDGCVTCPWHGFQYRLEDGCSPPPFTEKVATYPTRVLGNKILVSEKGNAPGTPQAPSKLPLDIEMETA